MASASIILYKSRQNREGKFPIGIRIIVKRKINYLFLNIHVEEAFWDNKKKQVKSSHNNALLINQLIQSKIKDVQDLIFEKESRDLFYTGKQIIEEVKGEFTGLTVFKFFDKYIEMENNAGKINSAKSDRSRLKNFKAFRKNKDLYFEELNQEMINSFVSYLSRVRQSSLRTQQNHLVLLRTIYNRAISQSIVKAKYYPFGRGKITIKMVESEKVGLNIDEIKAIENLELKIESKIWHVRNIFLISFYFAGIRISDVLRLRWGDFKDNRISYRMGKNNKIVNVAIPIKAKQILDLYIPKKKTSKLLIFPLLNTANWEDIDDIQRKINTAIGVCNTHLKKIGKLAAIEKNISNHIARHSFGNIASDKIPISKLQKLYRHSSLTTTAIYQGNFIHQDVDEALNDVLDY